METMGKRLKAYRLKRNLSQKQVADLVGISASTYRDWEYGKQIKGEPYAKLAQALGTTISELLGGQISHSDKVRELIAHINALDELVKLLRKTASAL